MKVRVHYDARTLHVGRGSAVVGGGVLGSLDFELPNVATQEEAEAHVEKDLEFVGNEIRNSLKKKKFYAKKAITDIAITKIVQLK